ncbi:MAG: flavin reductase family protein [Alphaproteobacteria bacterium]|nr:flavin reductase family protein [Alphaproteobacteria bacterium]OJV12239.1 MAG: hypothetical protein BGO27_05835 [Alphaproteobacteria bacterium 33-17]
MQISLYNTGENHYYIEESVLGGNFSEKDFKECLSHYSTGITVVSTSDSNGELYALTVNSFTSVSLKPPLVLFCLNKSSRSLGAFLESDSFAVTILDYSQHNIAKSFSSSNPDKWDGINYVLGATGSPIILPNLSFMECEKFTDYEAGDHYIIIGKVIHLDVAKADKKNPLIYFRGAYHHSPQPV